jgi:hypothetical protein
MESGDKKHELPSNELKNQSTLQKCVLPVSVILSSWFCGVIACGVTCSFVQSSAHLLASHPSPKVQLGAWAWLVLAAVIGILVGLHVGRNIRHCYWKDKK